jgi:DNA-binding NtrC family response regulator
MSVPTVSLLFVDDDAAFRHVMAGELARLGFAVETAASGEEAVARLREREPDVVLLDLQLPGMSGLDVLKVIREQHAGVEVVMLTGHGSIDSAIESIRVGAFDYVSKPCPLDELEIRIRRALERQALRRRAQLLERGLTPPDPGGSMVGASPAFCDVVQLVDRIAPTDSTVLITGETGSGKELIARLLHARSRRRARPFIVVECAALQESLLQSELFGHERGAFTGADRAKPGLFEVAHGGTIFLDEIGEVSPATQVKLLRVLDASTFRHVGGTSEIRVDVRVLAATNRDLPAMVRQGLFREDLYYRLRTISVELPPLRTRVADIELLAQHFAALINQRYGFCKTIGAEAAAVLGRHDWPGNVRELQHAVESAMVVCEGSEILPSHLPAAIRQAAPAPPAPQAGEVTPMQTLDELERAHVETALRATAGHRGQAAKLLGISERNLYRKLRAYGLPG